MSLREIIFRFRLDRIQRRRIYEVTDRSGTHWEGPESSFEGGNGQTFRVNGEGFTI